MSSPWTTGADDGKGDVNGADAGTEGAEDVDGAGIEGAGSDGAGAEAAAFMRASASERVRICMTVSTFSISGGPRRPPTNSRVLIRKLVSSKGWNIKKTIDYDDDDENEFTKWRRRNEVRN